MPTPYDWASTVVTCLLVFAITTSTLPGNANDETTPIAAQWVWVSRSRDDDLTGYFRRVFEADKNLKAAELRGITDFCRMTMYVNGQRIAVAENYGPLVSIDVTKQIRPGMNVIAVSADQWTGPAAVAMELTLTLADGSRKVIASNENWLAAKAPQDDWQQLDFNAAGWQRAVSFGQLETLVWGETPRAVSIDPFDDYTQWMQAQGSDAATDPSRFMVAPGFEIELLRTAQADEGSWISMAFDPRGRLVIGREDQGLLRLTLPGDGHGEMQVDTINDTLRECRGLLFAYDSLYVNANESKGLYRLRDTSGDDQFDEVKLLYQSPGGAGHGRNDLTLGPDGMIYSIHGDSVDLPKTFDDLTSPFREHRRGIKSSEGHVIRFDRDGNSWQLVAAGLRNPYGIDFNTDGELFTYDADAEHDMGAPWYRPTRVDHLVAGADFGWRGVTGSWPPYYPDHPDNALPNLDIGKGSPTSVKFGTRSSFPPPYRDALFILDWAYGRIVAVHMAPRGASYACRAETFIKGRPLNVTDLDFGPDGAMYLVTGGRKTKSGLYRIRYVDPPVEQPQPTAQQLARNESAAAARGLRRELESYCGRPDPQAISAAWYYLDSPDPWIQHAARLAVEHQPLADWQERALLESRPTAALTALLALARAQDRKLAPRIVERLNQLSLAELNTQQKLTAIYTYSLCLSQLDKSDQELATSIFQRLDPLYPEGSDAVNQRLSELLVTLDAPGVVDKTLALLAATTDPKQQLHYLHVLRSARSGWTGESRQAYFTALRQAKNFESGQGMPMFLDRIKSDAVAGLTETERAELASLLDDKAAPSADAQPTIIDRPLVKEWRSEDLTDTLAEIAAGRDLQRGKTLYAAALCSRCHRLGHEGTPIGPDLTVVSGRFSRPDLLDSILAPSKVVAEDYRSAQIVTSDGNVLVGRVLPGGDYRSPTLRIATNPLAPEEVTEIAKSKIESHTPSPVSFMPQGLLNTLTKEEILDLLAYIEAGGHARP